METVNNEALKLYNRVVRECVCDGANAVLLRAILIGSLEVSLWMYQTDDGGELGYAIKFKDRGILVYPGQRFRDKDMKAIHDGLSWAMSELYSRNTLRKWTHPDF